MTHPIVKSAKLAMSNPLQFIKVLKLSAVSRLPLGTNVYNRDWDVLILLDTCRPDALQSVCDEYDFLPSSIPTIYSVAGNSPEWVAKTFLPKYRKEIQDTVYITGNAWSERVLSEGWSPNHWVAPNAPTKYQTVPSSTFQKIVHSWKYADEESPSVDFQHPDPNKIVDHAISEGRSNSTDRMIIHIMEPHRPYLAQAEQEDREELHEYEIDPWTYLRNGGDIPTVWAAYIAELRKGLNSVQVLLKNLDAENVVISSDHGEAFGEFGGYGHEVGSLNPVIRRVPWVKTSATDTHSRDPTTEREGEITSAMDQLKALGYV